MIGEQFEHGDEICGAVVNVRTRQEKISVWTKNATNEAAQVTFFEADKPTSLHHTAFIICPHFYFIFLTHKKTFHTLSPTYGYYITEAH